MGIFTRMASGWEIGKTSIKVLNANKSFLVFPVLSGISIVFIVGSFFVFMMPDAHFNTAYVNNARDSSVYFVLFLFYLLNYFIVVFFNMGLMHCARLYFDGEDASVARGLRFSASRIGVIFRWALFAATAGIVLRMLQDRVGWLGKILIGLVGVAWSVATFFVVPVIAYENLGPVPALKRSAEMIKDKWGETIGANFSIGIVGAVAFFLSGIAGAAVSALVNDQLGIVVFVLGILVSITLTSAIRSIFISAVYSRINGNLNDYFDDRLLDGLFEPSRS